MRSRIGFSAGTGAVTLALLFSAAAATAATPDTWSGSNLNPGWSEATNWSPGIPGASAALVFPSLSAACNAGTSADTCYDSVDNLGQLSLADLSIDQAAAPYEIVAEDPSTDKITLTPPTGTAGLSVSPGPTPVASGSQIAYLQIPLTLGNAQTWTVEGGLLAGTAELNADDGVEVDQVGGNYALTLDVPDGGTVYNTTLGTGALTVSGDGSLVEQEQDNGNNTFTDATLPSSGLTLSGGPALYLESAGIKSGPLTITASTSPHPSVYVGQAVTNDGVFNGTDGTLAVSGAVNLDASANLFFDISQDGTTPSTDFGQITATGTVSLNGATIYVQHAPYDENGDCATLQPGDSAPIISTTGSLTGTLTYLDTSSYSHTLSVGQTSVPVPLRNDACPVNTPTPIAQLVYSTHAITATIIGYAPTSTLAPTISGTAAVGDTLTVTNAGTWNATPAATYSDQWLACASTCTTISGATGTSFTVTSAEAGDQIVLAVTATNAAGTTVVDSNKLGPVPTPPVTPVVIPLASSQIDSALTGVLKPSGKLAKIPKLLADGGFKFTFDAPGAGRLSVVWTTKVHKHVKTVATGALSTTGAGKDLLHMVLTAEGRKLLKHASGLSINVVTSFTPAGQTAVVERTSLRLT